MRALCPDCLYTTSIIHIVSRTGDLLFASENSSNHKPRNGSAPLKGAVSVGAPPNHPMEELAAGIHWFFIFVK